MLFSVSTNQTFSVLGELQGAPASGPLALSGNTLFVTSGGIGTVYSQNLDGSGFALLHSFSLTSANPPYTNADGQTPYGGVVVAGNMIYGTTSQGGFYGQGTIFAMNTNGSNFANLYNFTGQTDGGYPTAPLQLSGNKLYGYAYQNTNGSVFSINTDGTNFTVLHAFGSNIVLQVSELSSPPLVLLGSNIYGAMGNDLFSMDTNGSNFVDLSSVPVSGPMAVSSNVLYGTAYQGGAQAIVFALQLPTTPIITSEPTNLAIVVGNTASFSVVATGSQPLSYQWALNGTNIIGATSVSFTVTNAFPDNAGLYTVTITNDYGCTNSTPAHLAIIPISIGAPEMLANGAFQFVLSNAANADYLIQYSTNLTQWIPLVTINPSGGILTVTDPSATSSIQRFYRVAASRASPQ